MNLKVTFYYAEGDIYEATKKFFTYLDFVSDMIKQDNEDNIEPLLIYSLTDTTTQVITYLDAKYHVISKEAHTKLHIKNQNIFKLMQLIE